MKRHFGKWLTAAALAVGCTVMTANAFADTNGHWAESAINKWSGEYGIIQGYDDGTFRPDKSITRGAFAGILDRFLHFQNASPADTFSDTAGTYWEDAILKLHASGIYLGNQGAALPSSTITRQQAVAMIGRAFRIAPETAAPDYTDTDQIAEYALAYVGEFEARGYLTDSAAGTFRPADPITRAELINILSNMVDTLVKETTTVTENVSGSLLISAADGATLKGIKIGGSIRAGSFTSGGAEAISSTVALPRKAAAVFSAMAWMRSMIRAVSSRSKVRMVPSITASSGMILGACPP